MDPFRERVWMGGRGDSHGHDFELACLFFFFNKNVYICNFF